MEYGQVRGRLPHSSVPVAAHREHAKDDPSVDSVSSIWGGANWQEREAYDLMGIVFKNHPKLERILLPKDVMYHPLRKDFKG
jgi:NADH-quinone oxidoreductase subunit C